MLCGYPLWRTRPIRNHITYRLPELLKIYVLDDNVLRLQVTMNDPVAMQERNCLENIRDDLQDLVLLEYLSLFAQLK